VGSIVTTIIIVAVNDLRAFPLLDSIGLGHIEKPSSSAGSVFTDVYMLPWTRCGAYLVGFIFAFILIEHGQKVKVPWIPRTVVLSTSALIIFVMTFATYTEARWGWEAQEIHTFWLSFSHPVWAIGTCECARFLDIYSEVTDIS